MHSDDTAKRKFKRKRKGIGVLIFRQMQTSNSEEQTTYRITAAVSENTVYRRTKRHKKARNRRYCLLFLCDFRGLEEAQQDPKAQKQENWAGRERANLGQQRKGV